MQQLKHNIFQNLLNDPVCASSCGVCKTQNRLIHLILPTLHFTFAKSFHLNRTPWSLRSAEYGDCIFLINKKWFYGQLSNIVRTF